MRQGRAQTFSVIEIIARSLTASDNSADENVVMMEKHAYGTLSRFVATVSKL